MKRGRLPLTALRSFEAAGRLKSFTLAAGELFVSQAAISRQVRDLELLIGQPLFERLHRGVALTAAGIRLLETLTVSFDTIGAQLEEIGRERPALTLTVNSEPTFAACWLVPNLAEFRALRPDIDVTVDSDARLVEFRSGGADIAIRFSGKDRSWPRTQAYPLAEPDLVAVLSPHLLAQGPALVRPEDLLGHVLLHEENRSAWERWFAAAGVFEKAGLSRGPIFADGGLSLQAALRGHGVTLAERIFVDDDLAAGRLVQPFEHAIRYGTYFLVARDFSRLPEPAAAFAAWMKSRFPDATGIEG